MRPSNKSRSRNKNRRNNNNANSGGNVLNRVYDSAGPDGRVRGTPQQVIEKYQTLTHDSSLAGDRVAMENFQQHAEHYIRLINEAQRQIAERREAAEAQSGERNNNQQQRRKQGGDDVSHDDPANAPQPEVVHASNEQPAGASNGLDVESSASQTDLVETPEAKAREKKPSTRSRNPRPRKPKETTDDDTPPSAPSE